MFCFSDYMFATLGVRAVKKKGWVNCSRLKQSAEGGDFVIKGLIPGEFGYQQELQEPLASCTNLRTFVDTIPDLELLVYRFLSGDLLRISQSQRALSEETRRAILRSALNGLAQLHERGIIHTGGLYSGYSYREESAVKLTGSADIKPNNILVDFDSTTGDQIIIKSVQLSDLENAVLLGPGKSLKGCLCGNQLWRSPESWARALQNTPSDIFSFGVVAVYVMEDNMVLRASDEELNAADAWRHVLRRQVSYFGDEDGLIAVARDFDEHRPRKPWAMWHYVDERLRDLVSKMTSLDSGKRITAREALEHPWFASS
jgi:serine/threonine protein kinase